MATNLALAMPLHYAIIYYCLLVSHIADFLHCLYTQDMCFMYIIICTFFYHTIYKWLIDWYASTSLALSVSPSLPPTAGDVPVLAWNRSWSKMFIKILSYNTAPKWLRMLARFMLKHIHTWLKLLKTHRQVYVFLPTTRLWSHVQVLSDDKRKHGSHVNFDRGQGSKQG